MAKNYLVPVIAYKRFCHCFVIPPREVQGTLGSSVQIHTFLICVLQVYTAASLSFQIPRTVYCWLQRKDLTGSHSNICNF